MTINNCRFVGPANIEKKGKMCQLGVGNKMLLKRGRKNGKVKNKKVGQIDNLKHLVTMMLMNANDNNANNANEDDKEDEEEEEAEEEVTMEENGMPSSFNLHANMLEILERMPTSGNSEEIRTNSGGSSSSSSSVAIISSPNHSAVVNSTAAATAFEGMADFDWPQWMAQLPQMPKMLEQQNMHNIEGIKR
jgi:hypothetical protein